MKEEQLQVFIEGTKYFFSTFAGQQVDVGVPYLVSSDTKVAFDYTGIIGIAGARKGCVYFSAPGRLLAKLLQALGEEDLEDDNLCDVVGEVANTVSGNARRDLGPEFVISVPVIVKGQLEDIKLPREIRSFVIPITWGQDKAALVICLE
ncbi:chemotaxis protein CheX [Motilimonas eburnea]|uniref:chemotaxis protein CheX n=1 Tax=Motilimonas eburnea TaxID=1737488 RepID=UPI001E6355D7|nr:chemotaxis protein CheX [Motilimonas eburnea]MCE2571338.1 chemotaxis protein CheX [Motilimonas eburnea]